jgi:hypothetical protein
MKVKLLKKLRKDYILCKDSSKYLLFNSKGCLILEHKYFQEVIKLYHTLIIGCILYSKLKIKKSTKILP